MLLASLLCILAIGLSGTAALPNPSASTSSASTTAPRPAATHPRCVDKGCPAHDKVVWDTNLQACVCRWPLDPIGKCPLVCPEDQGLTFDEETDTCFCEPDTIAEVSKITARQTGVDASTCPLFVKCSNGYHAFYNETTKFCGCVANEPVPDPRTCPMIRCRSGFHPFYNATKETCICGPDDGETNCIAATECLIGHHPVWNSLTETCACVENDPVKVRDVNPSTCPNTQCTVSFSAVFDPATQSCSCVPHTTLCGPSAPYCATDADFNITTCTCQLRNPIPSFCKPIPCPNTMHLVYHPETKQCSCDVSCTSIACIAEEHPIYNSTTNSCYCGGYNGEETKREVPEPVEECTERPYCASGSTLNTTTCTCEITNPIPPTCPQMKCKSNTHVVYHPDEKKCSCDISCPDLMCIAEMHPMLNATDNTCVCAYIPGLEPPSEVDPPTAVQRDVATSSVLPIPELPCRDFFCISEKHPVFNTSSKTCSCEWIPGLEPNPTKLQPCGDMACMDNNPASYNATSHTCTCSSYPAAKVKERVPATATPTPSCSSTICTPEKTPIYSPSLGACTCAPIPGQEPVPMCPDTICIPEMQPVFNSAIQECECDWIPGLAPSCAETICIPEKQAVPDARGVCSCQWIPGLESRAEEMAMFEREAAKEERQLVERIGERESESVPACYFNPPCPDEGQSWEWEDGGCVCVPDESSTTSSSTSSRTRTKTSSSSTRSVSFSCTPTPTPNTMKTWTRTKSRTALPTTTTSYV